LKSSGGCLIYKNGKYICKHDHPKKAFSKTTVVYTRKKSKKCPNGEGYLMCKVEPERPIHCKNIN
jgi:hypothetical protein